MKAQSAAQQQRWEDLRMHDPETHEVRVKARSVAQRQMQENVRMITLTGVSPV